MISIESLKDNQLVSNVQRFNDEESLKQLIQRHTPLCSQIFQQYLPALQSSGIMPGEIYNETNLLVYNCAKSYDKNKGTKFSTHLGNHAHYLCLNLLNSQKSVDFEPKKIDYIAHVYDTTDKIDYQLIDYIDNILGQMHDPRIAKIFRLRFFETDKKKMPFKEIGTHLGMSSQAVINLFKKGCKFLRNKLNSQEFIDTI